jgi:hypothetical protein
MVEPATARQGRVGYPALAHLLSTRPLAGGDWWGPLPSHPISVLHLPSDGAGCPPGHRSRRAPLSFRDRSVRSGPRGTQPRPPGGERPRTWSIGRCRTNPASVRPRRNCQPSSLARCQGSASGFLGDRSERPGARPSSRTRSPGRGDGPTLRIRSDPIRPDPWTTVVGTRNDPVPSGRTHGSRREELHVGRRDERRPGRESARRIVS